MSKIFPVCSFCFIGRKKFVITSKLDSKIRKKSLNCKHSNRTNSLNCHGWNPGHYKTSPLQCQKTKNIQHFAQASKLPILVIAVVQTPAAVVAKTVPSVLQVRSPLKSTQPLSKSTEKATVSIAAENLFCLDFIDDAFEMPNAIEYKDETPLTPLQPRIMCKRQKENKALDVCLSILGSLHFDEFCTLDANAVPKIQQVLLLQQNTIDATSLHVFWAVIQGWGRAIVSTSTTLNVGKPFPQWCTPCTSLLFFWNQQCKKKLVCRPLSYLLYSRRAIP